MRQPPVEHVCLRHAAAHGGQAGLHLGDHPAVQAGQHLGQLGRVELADHLAGRWSAVRCARPAGQSAYRPATSVSRTSLAASQRDRYRGGRGVGVYVVDLARRAPGHAGDDRDAAVGDQRTDRPGVDRVDLADLAEVDRRPVHGGLGRGSR